jgi:hypothetical protein
VNQDGQQDVHAGAVDHAEGGGARAASQEKKNTVNERQQFNWTKIVRGTNHSSVSHSQARSYFNSNEGSVPTTAYKRPKNTQAFSWYGVFEKAFFPPTSHVSAWLEGK